MNIEIANKLLKLRKEHGLSQEQLASKLGISRQAVSKWERAEASPDTDNLIELAKLYNVSLDDLLLNEQVKKDKEKEEREEKEEYVHIGFDGIHVKDEDEVHVSWNGIHIKENEGHKVDIGKEGVIIDGKRYDKEYWEDISHNKEYDFPFASFIFFLYLIYLFYTGNWHPGWIILLTIPLFDSLITAIRKKRFSKFAYPILVVLIFLWVGFTKYIWHPAWIIFLTIPCYYMLAEYLDHKMKK